MNALQDPELCPECNHVIGATKVSCRLQENHSGWQVRHGTHWSNRPSKPFPYYVPRLFHVKLRLFLWVARRFNLTPTELSTDGIVLRWGR